jgi:hypothetical protein
MLLLLLFWEKLVTDVRLTSLKPFQKECCHANYLEANPAPRIGRKRACLALQARSADV